MISTGSVFSRLIFFVVNLANITNLIRSYGLSGTLPFQLLDSNKPYTMRTCFCDFEMYTFILAYVVWNYFIPLLPTSKPDTF